MGDQGNRYDVTEYCWSWSIRGTRKSFPWTLLRTWTLKDCWKNPDFFFCNWTFSFTNITMPGVMRRLYLLDVHQKQLERALELGQLCDKNNIIDMDYLFMIMRSNLDVLSKVKLLQTINCFNKSSFNTFIKRIYFQSLI